MGHRQGKNKGTSSTHTDSGGQFGTWVMGVPVTPQMHQQGAPHSNSAATMHTDHMKYPGPPVTGNVSYNPYVHTSPIPGSSGKSSKDTILNVLSRMGKKFDTATKEAGGCAGNIWQHLKIGPSLTDSAMGRLAHGTKVLTEGGQEKVFRQTFDSLPGEQLRKAYACYLSTSSGPVIGTLYLSTVKLAFCSDSPLSYMRAPGHQEWSYYKVVVRLDQLMAVSPSTNQLNPTEKYIQIITADGHEFWFMGFVSYDKAFKNLTDALQHQLACRVPYIGNLH